MITHPGASIAADEAIRHLYVHVPFCPTICPFCSFHVLERRSATVAAYLDRLDDELARLADRCLIEPDTVYLGGGTPSYLRPNELERLVAIVDRRVGWARTEATLEVHPSTASAAKVRDWVGLGFDRLSVGAQSFDDAVLATLHRPHDGDAGRRTVEWCLAAGATTGVDIMTAISGQDLATDLAVAVALGVDHVSAYTLTIEADTPFERQGVVVDDEAGATALCTTAALLGAAGYERYEVSNYARPGARSVHNQAYWTHDWFAGIGPSASSLLPVVGGGAVRCANPPTDDWLALDSLVFESSVAHELVSEPMTGADLLGDALLCGLRLVDGVDLDALVRRCGPAARSVVGSDVGERVAELVGSGLLERDGPRIRATSHGLMYLDRVAAAFL